MRFLGPTTCYTSPSSVKSVLIGGTYANLTNNNINIFVEVSSGSTTTLLFNDIPVPTGSSFVIGDAGKTIMLGGDELRVYCDTENGLDVTLGILQGVNSETLITVILEELLVTQQSQLQDRYSMYLELPLILPSIWI